jgi:hypothetical protein
MKNIQLIDCGYETYNVDMVSLRNVLDLLQSLKAKNIERQDGKEYCVRLDKFEKGVRCTSLQISAKE